MQSEELEIIQNGSRSAPKSTWNEKLDKKDNVH